MFLVFRYENVKQVEQVKSYDIAASEINNCELQFILSLTAVNEIFIK